MSEDDLIVDIDATHVQPIVRLACFQVRAASVEIDIGTLHSCFVFRVLNL